MAAGAMTRQGLTTFAGNGTGGPSTMRLTRTGPRMALEGFTLSAMLVKLEGSMRGVAEPGTDDRGAHPCDSVDNSANSNCSSAHCAMTWARGCFKKDTKTLVLTAPARLASG